MCAQQKMKGMEIEKGGRERGSNRGKEETDGWKKAVKGEREDRRGEGRDGRSDNI